MDCLPLPAWGRRCYICLRPGKGDDACLITTRLASCRGVDCIFQKAPRWPGDHRTSAVPAHTQHFPRSGAPRRASSVRSGGGRLFFKGRSSVSNGQMPLVLHGAERPQPTRISPASTECGNERQWRRRHQRPRVSGRLRPLASCGLPLGHCALPLPHPSLRWLAVFSRTIWRAEGGLCFQGAPGSGCGRLSYRVCLESGVNRLPPHTWPPWAQSHRGLRLPGPLSWGSSSGSVVGSVVAASV